MGGCRIDGCGWQQVTRELFLPLMGTVNQLIQDHRLVAAQQLGEKVKGGGMERAYSGGGGGNSANGSTPLAV